MNENATKWVAALRSGEYQQGEGYLLTSDEDEVKRYCCLGVACELYHQEHPDTSRWAKNSNFDNCVVFFIEDGDDHDSEETVLPSKVQDWLGLADGEGGYDGGSLIGLNDSEKYTFNKIADAIESEPNRLFAYTG